MQQSEEEIFELRANMATIEAESKYMISKSKKDFDTESTSLQTKISFLSSQLEHSEQCKLRFKKNLEMVQKNSKLETNRLLAEKRLLETKQRKQLFTLSQNIAPMEKEERKLVTCESGTQTNSKSASWILKNIEVCVMYFDK